VRLLHSMDFFISPDWMCHRVVPVVGSSRVNLCNPQWMHVG
jgi:hypothetical protein